MKGINKLNNKNKIDLVSLNNFLLEKEDDYLDILFQINNFKDKDYSNIKLQNYYIEKLGKILIPEELWKYYYFCEKAVSKNGRYLEDVPEDLKDYSICEKAVLQYGQNLQYVPIKLRDYSLCEKAVLNYSSSLQHVPENLRDSSLCEKALIGVKGKVVILINFIPKKLFYLKSFVNKIILLDSENLEYVPENLKDYSLCEKAVSKNGYALEYVPDELKDYSLCKKAVSNNGYALKYVPDELKDYSLCEKAAENGNALDYIPDSILNYNLVKLSYIYSKVFTILTIIRTKNRYIKYVSQLIKDFPEDKEREKLESLLLKEYIFKEVKKLLKEHYLKKR